MQKYEAHQERQNRKKQRLFRRLGLFAAILVITFGVLATYHVKQRSLQAEKKEQYESLQAEHKEQMQEEERLSNEIALLKDPDYVLEIARTNYFFSKKGEMIFKVPNENPSY